MQTQQHRYLSRLDHLRFLAATLVVLFHFFHHTQGDLRSGNALVSLIDEGHTGIALFMVISGFIFTVIAGDRAIQYGGFIRNRAIRIYPLLVVAAFLQLLGWLMPFRSDTIGLSPYFQQMWTIWVEMQFYLIFPFLLLFARHYGNRYLWGLLGLLFLLRALVYAASGEVRFLAYETLFGRLDQFLVGILLGRAWLSRGLDNPGTARSLNALWLLPAGAVVIMGLHLFSLRVGFAELKSPLWTVWPLLEAALWGLFVWVYLQARWPGPALVRGAVDRSLAALGAISFSTYVFHNLVLAAYNAHAGVITFTGRVHLDTILTGTVVVLPLVLVVATATYHLLEKPFLNMRRGYLT